MHERHLLVEQVCCGLFCRLCNSQVSSYTLWFADFVFRRLNLNGKRLSYLPFTVYLPTMRTKLLSAALLLCLSAVYLSCKKENTSAIRILLTDKPAAFEEVNVEIIGVRIKTSHDTLGWQELAVNPGIYNLLSLRNGITTQLANGQVPGGTLKEIRLLLGTNNSVKIDGVFKPLRAPGAEHAGLKIKVGKALAETLNTFVLDFDASLSIKTTGDKYMLSPVIRLK